MSTTGLTDIAIRNLQVGEMRREISDPGCAGLYVVVQPSGKKSFAVRYRFNGRPRKLTLTGGVSLKAARKLASDALLEVEQGRDPCEEKRKVSRQAMSAKAETVQWLCELYMRREGSKLRTAYARERELKRVVYPVIPSGGQHFCPSANGGPMRQYPSTRLNRPNSPQ
jgi:hypothetical protein